MANRNNYNDDRNRDEYGSSRYTREGRGEQRGQSGSGRESTQGGSTDYNRSEREGYRGISDNRETGRVNQGFGGTGFSSGYFGSDFGRGYDSQDRTFDDFASASRPGSTLTGDFGRNTGSGGERDFYGSERDARYADRSGDTGGYGERTQDFRNQGSFNQNQEFGYSGGGGSYARSYDRDQQDREHGGSSRYYGDQQGSSSYNNQGQQQRTRSENRPNYGGTSESGFDYSRSGQNRFPNQADSESEERGIWEKATDSVASFFGDNEARRRREQDARDANYGNYPERPRNYSQNNFQSGNYQETRVKRGPKNYRRSDERIREDIYDRLTDQYDIDASDIEVAVQNGEVTLTGMVDSRQAKRHAEDIAEAVSGVAHLENRLRVKGQNYSSGTTTTQSGGSIQNQAGFSSANTTNTESSGTYGSREDLAANYSNENLNEFSPVEKDVKGDLTGSSGLTDTSNTSGGANAGTASGTTGAVIGSNPGTGAAGTATSTAAEDFSTRGVDRLSQPATGKGKSK